MAELIDALYYVLAALGSFGLILLFFRILHYFEQRQLDWEASHAAKKDEDKKTS